MYVVNAIPASFINIFYETDDDSTTTQANNLQIRLTYDIVYIDFAKWGILALTAKVAWIT